MLIVYLGLSDVIQGHWQCFPLGDFFLVSVTLLPEGKTSMSFHKFCGDVRPEDYMSLLFYQDIVTTRNSVPFWTGSTLVGFTILLKKILLTLIVFELYTHYIYLRSWKLLILQRIDHWPITFGANIDLVQEHYQMRVLVESNPMFSFR